MGVLSRVLAHRDSENISVGSLLTICIGPPTSMQHKGLTNIINDKQKKKIIKMF